MINRNKIMGIFAKSVRFKQRIKRKDKNQLQNFASFACSSFDTLQVIYRSVCMFCVQNRDRSMRMMGFSSEGKALLFWREAEQWMLAQKYLPNSLIDGNLPPWALLKCNLRVSVIAQPIVFTFRICPPLLRSFFCVVKWSPNTDTKPKEMRMTLTPKKEKNTRRRISCKIENFCMSDSKESWR